MLRVFQVSEFCFDVPFHLIHIDVAHNNDRLQIGPVPLLVKRADCFGLEIIKEKIITDKIYYLGDTVDDMICAQSANVIGIGVLPPQDKSDELKDLLKSQKAMVVLNQTMDLEMCLGENYATK